MERMLVVGAGTMGRGIAHVGGLAGFEVTIHDKNVDQVQIALGSIRANLTHGVGRGKVSQEEMDAALARIGVCEDLCQDAERADVVIEAVFEEAGLKKKVIGHLDEHMPEHALLGSNTSSLSLSDLATSARHPERVVGMHFFNPVHVMKLLEIVRAQQTSEETVERTVALAERLGKIPIVVRDAPGFATSRLGVILGLEAMRMLEQDVASASDIDKAMELGYRHPMGPLELTDLVGLDVRLAIADHLHRELGGDQYRAPELLRALVSEGKLGRKSGEGFYVWREGKAFSK
jgi:3-hydroxybutyryl-CoA dehydrogenase